MMLIRVCIDVIMSSIVDVVFVDVVFVVVVGVKYNFRGDRKVVKGR